MKRLKMLETAVLIGLMLTFFVGGVTAFAKSCSDLRQNVVRLHILANSDQPCDQQIKLEIRDAILRELGPEFAAPADREGAKAAAQVLLPRMEEIARGVLEGYGRQETVSAQVVNMYFETRTYGDVTMPAGMYDAVRITIGRAQGHNWWCVLYPPLCVPAAEDEEELAQVQAIQEDEVAGKNPKYEPRFKIVEILEEIGRKLA